jgi:hypothetical protein
MSIQPKPPNENPWIIDVPWIKCVFKKCENMA